MDEGAHDGNIRNSEEWKPGAVFVAKLWSHVKAESLA